MSENISTEILELLNSVVNGKINDFSIDVKNFGGKGEGFTGDVLFGTLTNKKTKEQISTVVKEQKGYQGKPFEYTIPLFKNEIQFYNRIWPTLQKFYQEATGKSFNIVAKCLATTNGDFKKLALENLLASGFVLYDKQKPFNDEHFSFIFNTYGIYHGISAALKVQNREEFNKLIEPLDPLWKTAYHDESYTGKIFKMLSGQCKKLFDQETEKHVIDKLDEYEKNGANIVNDCMWQGRDGVILHADCWSNNFMFKYGVSILDIEWFKMFY